MDVSSNVAANAAGAIVSTNRDLARGHWAPMAWPESSVGNVFSLGADAESGQPIQEESSAGVDSDSDPDPSA
jgi:hypothetical protein